MIKNNKLLKSIALALCFFILAQDFAPAAESAQSKTYAAKQSRIAEQPTLSGEMNLVPKQWGAIEELYQGTNKQTVILIQDAHDSLEAQQNIARIISVLVKKDNVQTVFEEGYDGKVPTDKYFEGIADKNSKKKVSFYYLDQLELGGAEFAHINRRKDFALIGADSRNDYFENLRAYREAHANQAAIRRDLFLIQREFEVLARETFSGKAKAWLNEKQKFEKDELPFLEYLHRLKARAEGQTDFSAYPSLTGILESEKNPASEKALERINAAEIFEEIKTLERSLADAFFKNEKEKVIWKNLETLNLLFKLNELRLSREELGYLQSRLSDFKTDALAKFVARERHRPIVFSKRWENRIRSALRFYEFAGKRESRVEEILTSQNVKAGANPAVFVFGGFHKEGLKRIFKKLGFSYAVVTPRITETSPKHQKLYSARMLEQTQDDIFTAGKPTVTALAPATALRQMSLFFRAPGEAQKEIQDLAAVAPTARSLTDFSLTAFALRSEHRVLSETSKWNASRILIAAVTAIRRGQPLKPDLQSELKSELMPIRLQNTPDNPDMDVFAKRFSPPSETATEKFSDFDSLIEIQKRAGQSISLRLSAAHRDELLIWTGDLRAAKRFEEEPGQTFSSSSGHFEEWIEKNLIPFAQRHGYKKIHFLEAGYSRKKLERLGFKPGPFSAATLEISRSEARETIERENLGAEQWVELPAGSVFRGKLNAGEKAIVAISPYDAYAFWEPFPDVYRYQKMDRHTNHQGPLHAVEANKIEVLTMRPQSEMVVGSFVFSKDEEGKTYFQLISHRGGDADEEVPLYLEITRDPMSRPRRNRSEARYDKEQNERSILFWGEHHAHGMPSTVPPPALPFYAEFWRQQLRPLSAGSKVLDLATGNFFVPNTIREVRPDLGLWAIDQAPPHRPGAGIVFEQTPIEKLAETGFPKDFDLVTSQYGIEYSDWETSLPQVFSSLKEGGRAAFIVHHDQSGFIRQGKLHAEQYEFIAAQKLFDFAIAFFQDPQNQSKLDAVTQAFLALGGEANRRYALVERKILPQEAWEVLGRTVHATQNLFVEYEQKKMLPAQAVIKLRATQTDYLRSQFLMNDRVRTAISEANKPALARMFEKQGFQIQEFTPFYWERGGARLLSGWKIYLEKPVRSEMRLGDLKNRALELIRENKFIAGVVAGLILLKPLTWIYHKDPTLFMVCLGVVLIGALLGVFLASGFHRILEGTSAFSPPPTKKETFFPSSTTTLRGGQVLSHDTAGGAAADPSLWIQQLARNEAVREAFWQFLKAREEYFKAGASMNRENSKGRLEVAENRAAKVIVQEGQKTQGGTQLLEDWRQQGVQSLKTNLVVALALARKEDPDRVLGISRGRYLAEKINKELSRRSELRTGYALRQQRVYDKIWDSAMEAFKGIQILAPREDSRVLDISLNTGFSALADGRSDFSESLDRQLDALSREIVKVAAAYKIPALGQHHVTLFEIIHQATENPTGFYQAQKAQLIKDLRSAIDVFRETGPFDVSLEGLNIGKDGTIIAKGYVTSDRLERLRTQLSLKIPRTQWGERVLFHVTLARLDREISKADLEKIVAWVAARRELPLGTFRVNYPLFVAIENNHATVIDRARQDALDPFNLELRSEAREYQKFLTETNAKVFRQSFSGLRAAIGTKIFNHAHLLAFAMYGYFYALEKVRDKKDFERTVLLLARDPRPSGPAIRQAILRGFRLAEKETGKKIETVDLGIVTTPMIEAYVRSTRADGGVMITASHNPIEQGGLKFLSAWEEKEGQAGAGAVLDPQTMGRIIARFQAVRANHSEWQALKKQLERAKEAPGEDFDALPMEAVRQGNVEFLKTVFPKIDFKVLEGFEISIHSNGGAAGGGRSPAGLGHAAWALGQFNIVAREIIANGKKTTHGIEPHETSEGIFALRERVKALGHPFGLMFDFDADRGSMEGMDNQTVAAFNIAMMLALTDAYQLSDKKEIVIIATDATSRRVEDIANLFSRPDRKVSVRWVETGETNVVDAMQEERRKGKFVPIGVEGANAGTVLMGSTSRDGIATAILTALALRDPAIQKVWTQALVSAGFSAPEKTLKALADSVPQRISVYKTIPELPEDMRIFKTKMEARLRARWAEDTGFRERYSSWEIKHYSKKRLLNEMPEDLDAGWRINLTRADGKGEFIWIRPSRTEGGLRHIVDAVDSNSAEYLKNVFTDLFSASRTQGRSEARPYAQGEPWIKLPADFEETHFDENGLWSRSILTKNLFGFASTQFRTGPVLDVYIYDPRSGLFYRYPPVNSVSAMFENDLNVLLPNTSEFDIVMVGAEDTTKLFAVPADGIAEFESHLQRLAAIEALTQNGHFRSEARAVLQKVRRLFRNSLDKNWRIEQGRKVFIKTLEDALRLKAAEKDTIEPLLKEFKQNGLSRELVDYMDILGAHVAWTLISKAIPIGAGSLALTVNGNFWAIPWMFFNGVVRAGLAFAISGIRYPLILILSPIPFAGNLAVFAQLRWTHPKLGSLLIKTLFFKAEAKLLDRYGPPGETNISLLLGTAVFGLVWAIIFSFARAPQSPADVIQSILIAAGAGLVAGGAMYYFDKKSSGRSEMRVQDTPILPDTALNQRISAAQIAEEIFSELRDLATRKSAALALLQADVAMDEKRYALFQDLGFRPNLSLEELLEIRRHQLTEILKEHDLRLVSFDEAAQTLLLQSGAGIVKLRLVEPLTRARESESQYSQGFRNFVFARANAKTDSVLTYFQKQYLEPANWNGFRVQFKLPDEAAVRMLAEKSGLPELLEKIASEEELHQQEKQSWERLHPSASRSEKKPASPKTIRIKRPVIVPARPKTHTFFNTALISGIFALILGVAWLGREKWSASVLPHTASSEQAEQVKALLLQAYPGKSKEFLHERYQELFPLVLGSAGGLKLAATHEHPVYGFFLTLEERVGEAQKPAASIIVFKEHVYRALQVAGMHAQDGISPELWQILKEIVQSGDKEGKAIKLQPAEEQPVETRDPLSVRSEMRNAVVMDESKELGKYGDRMKYEATMLGEAWIEAGSKAYKIWWHHGHFFLLRYDKFEGKADEKKIYQLIPRKDYFIGKEGNDFGDKGDGTLSAKHAHFKVWSRGDLAFIEVEDLHSANGTVLHWDDPSLSPADTDAIRRSEMRAEDLVELLGGIEKTHGVINAVGAAWLLKYEMLSDEEPSLFNLANPQLAKRFKDLMTQLNFPETDLGRRAAVMSLLKVVPMDIAHPKQFELVRTAVKPATAEDASVIQRTMLMFRETGQKFILEQSPNLASLESLRVDIANNITFVRPGTLVTPEEVNRYLQYFRLEEKAAASRAWKIELSDLGKQVEKLLDQWMRGAAEEYRAVIQTAGKGSAESLAILGLMDHYKAEVNKRRTDLTDTFLAGTATHQTWEKVTRSTITAALNGKYEPGDLLPRDVGGVSVFMGEAMGVETLEAMIHEIVETSIVMPWIFEQNLKTPYFSPLSAEILAKTGVTDLLTEIFIYRRANDYGLSFKDRLRLADVIAVYMLRILTEETFFQEIYLKQKPSGILQGDKFFKPGSALKALGDDSVLGSQFKELLREITKMLLDPYWDRSVMPSQVPGILVIGSLVANQKAQEASGLPPHLQTALLNFVAAWMTRIDNNPKLAGFLLRDPKEFNLPARAKTMTLSKAQIIKPEADGALGRSEARSDVIEIIDSDNAKRWGQAIHDVIGRHYFSGRADQLFAMWVEDQHDFHLDVEFDLGTDLPKVLEVYQKESSAYSRTLRLTLRLIWGGALSLPLIFYISVNEKFVQAHPWISALTFLPAFLVSLFCSFHLLNEIKIAPVRRELLEFLNKNQVEISNRYREIVGGRSENRKADIAFAAQKNREGRQFLQERKFSAARQVFEEGWRKDADNLELLCGMSEAFIGEGNLPRAWAELVMGMLTLKRKKSIFNPRDEADQFHREVFLEQGGEVWSQEELLKDISLLRKTRRKLAAAEQAERRRLQRVAMEVLPPAVPEEAAPIQREPALIWGEKNVKFILPAGVFREGETVVIGPAKTLLWGNQVAVFNPGILRDEYQRLETEFLRTYGDHPYIGIIYLLELAREEVTNPPAIPISKRLRELRGAAHLLLSQNVREGAVEIPAAWLKEIGLSAQSSWSFEAGENGQIFLRSEAHKLGDAPARSEIRAGLAKVNQILGRMEIPEPNERDTVTFDRIAKKISGFQGRSVVFLGGPSAAGKTHLTNNLRDRLEPRQLKEISLDRYFKSRTEMVTDGEQILFDHPDSSHLNLAAEHIRALLRGEEVELPYFDMKTGIFEPHPVDTDETKKTKRIKLEPGEVLVVDSIHALRPEILEAAGKAEQLKVYVKAPGLVRLARRMKRDVERGYTHFDTLKFWPYLMDLERQFIYPSEAAADEVFENYYPEAQLISQSYLKQEIAASVAKGKKGYKAFLKAAEAALIRINREEAPIWEARRFRGKAQGLLNLMLAINLMDLGAEISERGIIFYKKNFSKLKEVLPLLRKIGIRKIYLYGLAAVSELSKEVHTRPNRGKHFLTKGKATVLVANYEGRRESYGKVKADDSHGNIFSIGDMKIINPQFSETPETAEQELREITALARELDIAVTTDFISWRSPDAVDETNYRQTFYRELSDAQNQEFRKLSGEKEKQNWINQLVEKSPSFFAVRITENKEERVILVKQLCFFGGCSADQAILNLLHPEVKKYFIQSLKKLIDRGADQVRIDLGHMLLKQNLRGYFDEMRGQGVNLENWLQQSGIKMRKNENFESWFARQGDPWNEVVDTAKAYALSQGRRIRFTTETYDPSERQRLFALGINAGYDDIIFKTYEALARQREARADWLDEPVNHLLHDRPWAFAYLTNFDQIALLMIGGPMRAGAMLLAALSHLGVPSMVDLRDFMLHRGHFLKIVGGTANPDDPHTHPFPSEAEIRSRAGLLGTRHAIETAPWRTVLEDFLNIDPGKSERYIQILDNENRQRFFSLGWMNEKGDWIVTLLDFKGGEKGEVRVKLPPSNDATRFNPSDYEAVDADGNVFEFAQWNGQPGDHPEIVRIRFGERERNSEYKVIKLRRKATAPPMPPQVDVPITRETMLSNPFPEGRLRQLEEILSKPQYESLRDDAIFFALMDEDSFVRGYAADILSGQVSNFTYEAKPETVIKHLLNPLVSLEGMRPRIPGLENFERSHAIRNKRHVLLLALAHMRDKSGVNITKNHALIIKEFKRVLAESAPAIDSEKIVRILNQEGAEFALGTETPLSLAELINLTIVRSSRAETEVSSEGKNTFSRVNEAAQKLAGNVSLNRSELRVVFHDTLSVNEVTSDLPLLENHGYQIILMERLNDPHETENRQNANLILKQLADGIKGDEPSAGLMRARLNDFQKSGQLVFYVKDGALVAVREWKDKKYRPVSAEIAGVSVSAVIPVEEQDGQISEMPGVILDGKPHILLNTEPVEWLPGVYRRPQTAVFHVSVSPEYDFIFSKGDHFKPRDIFGFYRIFQAIRALENKETEPAERARLSRLIMFRSIQVVLTMLTANIIIFERDQLPYVVYGSAVVWLLLSGVFSYFAGASLAATGLFYRDAVETDHENVRSDGKHFNLEFKPFDSAFFTCIHFLLAALSIFMAIGTYSLTKREASLQKTSQVPPELQQAVDPNTATEKGRSELRQRNKLSVVADAAQQRRQVLPLQRIEEAERLQRKYGIHETSLTESRALNEWMRSNFGLSTRIFFKDETENPTGSFKDRAPIKLYVDAESGKAPKIVLAVSTGNHGRAAARAVKEVQKKYPQIRVQIYMPAQAAPHKIQAIRDLGAEIVTQNPETGKDFENYAEALEYVETLAGQKGYLQITHADEYVVAGYSVVGAEIARQLKNKGFLSGKEKIILMGPLGSGGFFSGWALELKARIPNIKAIAAVSSPADAVFRAVRGESPRNRPLKVVPHTDGSLATAEKYAVALIKNDTDEMIRVTDKDALYATALLRALNVVRYPVEATSGIALAALLLYPETANQDSIIVMPLTSKNVSEATRAKIEELAANPDQILKHFQTLRRSETRKAKTKPDAERTELSNFVKTADGKKSEALEDFRILTSGLDMPEILFSLLKIGAPFDMFGLSVREPTAETAGVYAVDEKGEAVEGNAYLLTPEGYRLLVDVLKQRLGEKRQGNLDERVTNIRLFAELESDGGIQLKPQHRASAPLAGAELETAGARSEVRTLGPKAEKNLSDIKKIVKELIAKKESPTIPNISRASQAIVGRNLSYYQILNTKAGLNWRLLQSVGVVKAHEFDNKGRAELLAQALEEVQTSGIEKGKWSQDELTEKLVAVMNRLTKGASKIKADSLEKWLYQQAKLKKVPAIVRKTQTWLAQNRKDLDVAARVKNYLSELSVAGLIAVTEREVYTAIKSSQSAWAHYKKRHPQFNFWKIVGEFLREKKSKEIPFALRPKSEPVSVEKAPAPRPKKSLSSKPKEKPTAVAASRPEVNVSAEAQVQERPALASAPQARISNTVSIWVNTDGNSALLQKIRNAPQGPGQVLLKREALGNGSKFVLDLDLNQAEIAGIKTTGDLILKTFGITSDLYSRGEAKLATPLTNNSVIRLFAHRSEMRDGTPNPLEMLKVKHMPFDKEVFLSERQGMDLLAKILPEGGSGQMRRFTSLGRSAGEKIITVEKFRGEAKLLLDFLEYGGHKNFIIEKDGSLSLLQWIYGDGAALQQAAQDLVRVDDLNVFFRSEARNVSKIFVSRAELAAMPEENFEALVKMTAIRSETRLFVYGAAPAAIDGGVLIRRERDLNFGNVRFIGGDETSVLKMLGETEGGVMLRGHSGAKLVKKNLKFAASDLSPAELALAWVSEEPGTFVGADGFLKSGDFLRGRLIQMLSNLVFASAA